MESTRTKLWLKLSSVRVRCDDVSMCTGIRRGDLESDDTGDHGATKRSTTGLCHQMPRG
jgi:hypothetical protein